MRPIHSLLAVISISLGLFPVLSASAQPDGPIVGRIKDITPDQTGAVWLIRPDGKTEQVEPYQTLNAGDIVEVREPGVSVALEMAPADGGEVTISNKDGRYPINSHLSLSSAFMSLATISQRFAWVFSKPKDVQYDGTVPRSVDATGQLAANRWLPQLTQSIRSKSDQDLVIAWNGSKADVTLEDQSGTTMASSSKADPGALPGFALIHCKALGAGMYTLKVSDGTDELNFRVVASDKIPGRAGDYVTQAVDASNRLSGDAENRMQALADLQAVANEVYLAKATIEAVREGRTPP